MTKLTADQRFERDIPEDQREDIMTLLAEVAHEICTDDRVTILERDRIDAINVRVHGIVEVNSQEYRFILQDGNWNGTILEDWDGDKEFEPTPRMIWALQPAADLVDRAILDGKGPFLVLKWDAILKRAEVASIPGKYAYDRMVQPGGKIETHYREQAAKHRLVLVSKEEAEATRKRLQAAA